MLPQLDFLMHYVDKKCLDSIKEIQELKKTIPLLTTPTHLTSPRAFLKELKK